MLGSINLALLSGFAILEVIYEFLIWQNHLLIYVHLRFSRFGLKLFGLKHFVPNLISRSLRVNRKSILKYLYSEIKMFI
ncbi:hypothetical protein DET48_13617 [Vibrio diazotrophicus]|jgi:hypothetical protein|uniref:Uncharacterized protein n=1 Tax=Vibrio diazotrophicus TaxID=685 RepID=A0A329E7A8_VIBDI|nr:hypothetical protein DET48_13617 [Vibrio diazotrophicus]